MNKFRLYMLPVLLMTGLLSQVTAQTNCPLTCRNQIVVALENDTDLVEVLPSDILIGDYTSCANFDPVVEIGYVAILAIHPTTPSVGADDVGLLLTASVTDQTSNSSCLVSLRVVKEGPIDLKAGSVYSPLGYDLCVPIYATNFLNIASFSSSVVFDPSVMTFANVIQGHLATASFDLANLPSGELGFEWLNDTPTSGSIDWASESFPLFTLCFETLQETSSAELCFGDSPTATSIITRAGKVLDYSFTCGDIQIAACKVNCLPDLSVTISSDEERTLDADYFLLRGGCNFSDLTLNITDETDTDIGTTLSAAHTGQSLTATIEASASESSCVTNLTVVVCDTEPVNIEIAQQFDGNDLVAQLRVDNLSNVLGYQFTLEYDPEVLSFVEFVSGEDIGFLPTQNASSNDGKLLVLRATDNGFPLTIQDGEVLMSVRFQVLKEENTTLSFGNDPLEIMFIDGDTNELCVNAPPREIAISGSGTTGNIYDDVNQDCAYNAGDLNVKNWLVEMEDQITGVKYYNNTDADGNYLIYAPQGTYTLTAYSGSNLWSFCENGMTVTIQTDDQKVEQDFYAQADVLCPALTVDLSTPFLRRCFDNTYHVSYCNDGTTLATDAYIEIELDAFMTFVNSSASHTISGQTVTFDLGDIPYGECGNFAFTILLDCTATTIGQTHCIEAQILPQVECFTTDPAWSGASLVIDGECNGQTMEFTITNVGVGDMSKAIDFIVIEDDVMREGSPIDLDAGQSFDVPPLPADGTTYRVIIPQEDNHPGESMPTLAVEGCGTNSTGSFSTGFVNMYPHNDGDGYIDIDCSQSIGSWDPNDKAVAPTGYTDRKFVSANTDLDYKIRFQNTGTDTAFRVVVKDIIEEDLDLSTIKLGASSHDYIMTIEEGRTLVFTFDDIYLVDSTRNEPGSHGFIKFKIAQHADKPDGTFLSNDANIFFDFNAPVETNLTELEIGSAEGSFTKNFVEIDLTVFPNPTADKVNISHSYSQGKVLLKLYDQQGRLVLKKEIQNEDSFSIAEYPEGIYDYRMTSNNRILSIGKISKM